MKLPEAATVRRRTHRKLLQATVPLSCGILAIIAAAGCDFPYSPRRQPDPYVNDTAAPRCGFSGSGSIYPVNPSQQSCNPSIAPRGEYSGCMLFLGSDRLSVAVPESLSAYRAIDVASHDRLSIVDTANTLRWFIVPSELEGSGELQCPEWSNHPDYLSCLVEQTGKQYSGHAVRLSDKRRLKLCDGVLEELSTPYLWIGDSVGSGNAVEMPGYDDEGFVNREDVERFFGTTRVKFVYTLPGESGMLYFVDYAPDTGPSPQPLSKPAGGENWYCASPLVSPDGGWVAYHCFTNPSKGPYYSSYIQRLKPGSTPRLIADGASDPHWWVDPFTGDYYIIYTVIYDDYFTEYDFTDSSVGRGNLAGCTLKRRLTGAWADVPAHMGTLAADASSPPDTLIRLPFKGGLSADGYFLCTAYKYAYIAKLAGE
ncbi:MAG: hypothetical protein JW913_05490 [Chitinispirillaceae bacterium]|nr:hypothetical protein [Chitinispirillaceae bacterium]